VPPRWTSYPAALKACLRAFGRYRWLSGTSDQPAFWLGYAVLLPVFVAPLLATPLLPGLDLPFHLATADMLLKAGGESPYAPAYQPTLGLAPYAVHYLLLVGLGAVGSWCGNLWHLADAHLAVTAAYVASLPLATAAFLKVCGRSRIPALLAFPLAYNLCLHYGFFSFCLSLPLLMGLLAALARTLSDSASGWPRWALVALLASVLFLSHLQNFLFGLCACCALLVFSRAPVKSRGVAVVALLPAVLLMVRWWIRAPLRTGAHESGVLHAWNSLKGARLADLAQKTLSADLAERLEVLPEMLLKGFHDMIDVRAAQSLLLWVAVYFALGVFCSVARGSGVSRPRFTTACWVIVAGALLAFLALPHHLWAYELMTFYPRFSVLVALLLLPVIPASLLRARGWLSLVILAPALGFGWAYGGVLRAKYTAYGHEVSSFVRVLKKAEPGHRLAGLVYGRQSSVFRNESTNVGLANHYVALNSHPESMVPLPYCNMRHMPCTAAGLGARAPYPGPWLDKPFSPEAFADTYRYVLAGSVPPGFDLWGQLDKYTIVAREGPWVLFRWW